jgi:AraC family transcriptional regulator
MKATNRTPPRAWADYTRALERVVAHIEAHAESNGQTHALDLTTLAEVACLSPFHFHRVFHAMRGETVMEAVQRVRLQRVAALLANGSLSVEAIAKRCGYASSPPLVRVFKAHYGLTPAAYRKRGPHRLYDPSTDAPGAAHALSVHIQNVCAHTLVVTAHRGPYIRVGEAFERCWLQCAKQLRRAGRQPLEPQRAIAVYLDDPAAVSTSRLRSFAGYVAAEPFNWQAPLQAWEIPAGRAAVMRYRGPYASMHAAYRWLFGQWLPSSGEAPGEHPVYEAYLNHPHDTAPADLLTDIYLPLAT